MTSSQKKFCASLAMALLLISAAWQPVAACINLYSKNLQGESVKYHRHSTILEHLTEHQKQDKSEWETKRAALKAEATAPGAKFESRADYASIGIYLGDVPSAIEQLEALEKEKPGEGIIASNLGTAYELNGNTEKALDWIKEGIKRNPKDHEGTEWLHVKILEAKLELAKDKDWLKTHSVLEMDFGNEPKPTIPAKGPTDFLGATKTLHEVEIALVYQLHERIYFVNPPDPIVAELIADLASVAASSHSLAEAKEIMAFALTYNPVQADLCAQRLEYFDKNSYITNWKQRNINVSFIVVVTIFVLSMYWFVKKVIPMIAR